MIQYKQKNRQVHVESPLGEDVLLLKSFSGSESLSRGFHYVATVLSKDSSIDGNLIVGKNISVIYFDEDGRERVFNGHVGQFEYIGQVEQPAEMSSYSLTIVPWMWFLTHNSDCQIFQEMTAPDIIKKIFQEHGFSDYQFELSGSYPEREYCVQYRETDFNFVSRLMEEEGIFYYYKHEKGKHTLVVCDERSSYYDLGESEVKYGTSDQSQFKQLTGWRHVYAFRTGKFAQRDFDFKKPTDRLKSEEKSQIKFEDNSKFELYEYPGLYVEQGEGNRLAKVRLQEIESEHDRIEGSGHYLTFSPGGKFKVEKHSRKGDEGKDFVLTEVFTELYSNIGNDQSGGVDFHNEFRCIPAETLFRPARMTEKPVVEGPQTAIVTTDGQEIVVDEFARVKVQFHWDRYGQRDIRSSCWIRVSQHHSGKGWGMIDIPRKDEEVIVSFLDGDPDRPIITGRVYNGDNNPPFDLKGASNNLKNKTRRGNTTKTYEGKGFNEFSMDDADGKEQVFLHAEHNMDVRVKNDSKERIYGNRHQIVGWEKDGGKGGSKNEEIKKDKNLKVHSNHVEHIGGDMQLLVGDGDGDGNQDIVIKSDRKLLVEGTSHEHVVGAKLVAIDENRNENVGGDQVVDVSGSSAHIAGKDHWISGTNILVEGTAICLKSGGNSITIDSTGVTIVGTLVRINSGPAAPVISQATMLQSQGPEDAEPASPAEPAQADTSKSNSA